MPQAAQVWGMRLCKPVATRRACWAELLEKQPKAQGMLTRHSKAKLLPKGRSSRLRALQASAIPTSRAAPSRSMLRDICCARAGRSVPGGAPRQAGHTQHRGKRPAQKHHGDSLAPLLWWHQRARDDGGLGCENGRSRHGQYPQHHHTGVIGCQCARYFSDRFCVEVTVNRT